MKKKITSARKKDSLVDGSMSFAEVLRKYPESAEIFFRHGMHCIGCPASMHESLKDGIMAHGLDAEKIMAELNNRIRGRKK